MPINVRTRRITLAQDTRVWSAALSPQAGVSAFYGEIQHLLQEAGGVLLGRGRSLMDFLVHKDDIRFHVTPEGDVVMHARSDRGERLVLLPTLHALRQIVKRVRFDSLRLFDLLERANPQLLVENLNFLTMHLPPQKFLLRAYNDSGVRRAGYGDRPLVLRAFLARGFSTEMDNIYLCRALGDVLSKSFLSDNGVKGFKLYCSTRDGGDMLVDIMLAKQKLTVLKEEYHSGLRLRASEVGRYREIVATALLTRLVCDNGMVATFGDKRASISYYTAKPEYEWLRDEVARIVKAGLDSMQESRENYAKRVNRLIADAEQDPENFGEDDIRVALSFVIRKSGLSTVGGVSVDDVVNAYGEERNERPDTNPAWLLVNAFTRYASHNLAENDLHLAQAVQKAMFESLLNPQRITWAGIVREVRAKRQPVTVPAEPDEDND